VKWLCLKHRVESNKLNTWEDGCFRWLGTGKIVLTYKGKSINLEYNSSLSKAIEAMALRPKASPNQHFPSNDGEFIWVSENDLIEGKRNPAWAVSYSDVFALRDKTVKKTYFETVKDFGIF
jgi:hypothetical protein